MPEGSSDGCGWREGQLDPPSVPGDSARAGGLKQKPPGMLIELPGDGRPGNGPAEGAEGRLFKRPHVHLGANRCCQESPSSER